MGFSAYFFSLNFYMDNAVAVLETVLPTALPTLKGHKEI